jgi:hypothetical protein
MKILYYRLENAIHFDNSVLCIEIVIRYNIVLS